MFGSQYNIHTLPSHSYCTCLYLLSQFSVLFSVLPPPFTVAMSGTICLRFAALLKCVRYHGVLDIKNATSIRGMLDWQMPRNIIFIYY